MSKKNFAYTFLTLIISSSLVLAGPFEKKIDSQLGKQLLHLLLQSLDEKSTTTMRREYKSVVDEAYFFQHIMISRIDRLEDLFTEPIVLRARDREHAAGSNETFTFYGHGIRFKVEGRVTRLKLRARFYLVKTSQKQFIRPHPYESQAYLEIKVGSAEKKDVVHKFRILVADEVLQQLFQLDPKHPEFSRELLLLAIKTKARAENRNKTQLVDALFSAIETLARIEPQFIKPVLATSYQRKAFTIQDQQHRVFNGSKVKGAEYQFVYDKHIKGYIPELALADKNFRFIDYFNSGCEKDVVFRYPKHAVVVEVKLPLHVEGASENQQSPEHRFVLNRLLTPISQSVNILSGYRFGRGKMSTLLNELADSGLVNPPSTSDHSMPARGGNLPLECCE